MGERAAHRQAGLLLKAHEGSEIRWVSTKCDPSIKHALPAVCLWRLLETSNVYKLYKLYIGTRKHRCSLVTSLPAPLRSKACNGKHLSLPGLSGTCILEAGIATA